MKRTVTAGTGEGNAPRLGEQKYIVISDRDGLELTEPMSWGDAVRWVQTKAWFKAVVIAPATYPVEGK